MRVIVTSNAPRPSYCLLYPSPNKDPIFRWRAHAHLLYTNWLNYYVYQNTPYDLDDLEAVVRCV